MTTARHIECPIDQYHARPEWSRSQIEDLRASPALFHGRHVAKPPLYPRETSAALDVGTVAHQCLTAPGGIDQVVIEIPADVLNDQGYRKGKAWTDWSEANAARIQMKASELAPIRQMVRNTYAHPVASRLLAAALHTEYSIVWRDEETGLDLRARPDLLAADNGKVALVDFKTTRAPTPREFAADVAKFGYHRQLAFYAEGVQRFGYEVSRYLFICVDKTPAHECRVYAINQDDIEQGRAEVRDTLRDLARRLDKNDWTDPHGRDVIPVRLPTWARDDGEPIELSHHGQPLTL